MHKSGSDLSFNVCYSTIHLEWNTMFQTLKHTTTGHPEEELDILSRKENTQELSSNGRRDVTYAENSGFVVYCSRKQN